MAKRSLDTFSMAQELEKHGFTPKQTKGLALVLYHGLAGKDDFASKDDLDREVGELTRKIDDLGKNTDAGFNSIRKVMKAGDNSIRTDMDAGFESIRTDMNAGFDSIRTDMDAGFESIRTDMDAGFESIRTDMNAGFDSIRKDMNAGDDSIRKDMNTGFAQLRAEMFKQHLILAATLIVILKGLDLLFP